MLLEIIFVITALMYASLNQLLLYSMYLSGGVIFTFFICTVESLFVIKWRGGAWGQGITQYLTYMQKETSTVHKDTCHCFGEKEAFAYPG